MSPGISHVGRRSYETHQEVQDAKLLPLLFRPELWGRWQSPVLGSKTWFRRVSTTTLPWWYPVECAISYVGGKRAFFNVLSEYWYRPRCWNGKDLDSPNHQDHVAYPTSGPSNFLSTGNCPASHPVKIPQLMLEVRVVEYQSRLKNLLIYALDRLGYHCIQQQSGLALWWFPAVLS